MKNKFTVILLIMSILASLFVLPASAENPTDENVAYAILGENVKTKNFATVRVGAQADNKLITERKGEPCWIIDKANGLQSDKLCMIFDEEFKSGVNNGDAFIVEVDYFDVAKGGFFFLAYDGQRPKITNEYYHQAGETVYTQGTEKWKTATFRVDDPDLNKGLEGGNDMFVGTRLVDALNNPNYLSQVPIPFKEIRVTKVPGANPLRNIVSIDEFGNTYSWFSEDKVIHNKFTNLKNEDISYDITYEFTDVDGHKIYEKSETVNFLANETKDVDFNFGELKTCGRFNYIVNVKNEELGINSRVQYSVIAIIKADPDGIINEHMNMCGPGYKSGHGVTLETFSKALDMMKTAGFAGARYDDGWNGRETATNNFGYTTYADGFMDTVIEKGMEALPIMYMSNNLVTGAWNVFPETDEQFKRAEIAADKMIQQLAGRTDIYEAWNEPDITNFGKNFTPERYVRVYKPMAEALKKYDPDAKIGYLCYAGAGSTNTHIKTTEMFELGLAEMIRGNAITFHGYPDPNPEKFRTAERIQWYIDELEKFGVHRDEYEVWITEYGGTVADDHIATRRRQGGVTVRETLMQRINHNVDKFYVYRYDDPGNLIHRREASFGHVSTSTGFCTVYGAICVPWESFVMLSGYNYLFANSEPVGKITDEENLKIYEFKSNKFGEDIITLNSVSGVESVTLDLGVKSVRYFDEYANEVTLYSDDGIYTFSATEYPHYVMADFSDVSVLGKSEIILNDELEAVSEDLFTVNVENNTGKELKAVFELPEDKEKEVVLKQGNNSLELENPAEEGKVYEIRCNVFDGEKQISVLCMEIESVYVAKTNLALQLKSPKNFNKWQGIATISNTSEAKAISGQFEVTAPENLKTKVPVKVSYIPRKRTAEVIFDLPEITKKQIYTFEYKLTLDTGEIIEGETKADTTSASYASAKPKIDGVIEKGEWNEQTLMQTSNIENVVYVGTWTGNKWQGPKDQSAKTYAMWDEEKVYLCWEVTDDVFSQEYDDFYTWQGDSVQFGVYMGSNDEYITIGEANTTFTEIGIANTPKGAQIYRYSAQDPDLHKNGQLTNDGCELGIKTEGDKTVYELSMPWRSLLPEGINPKANSRLGFSFLVNDNDGQGRRGAILFANGIFGVKDSSQFTYINLIGEN